MEGITQPSSDPPTKTLNSLTGEGGEKGREMEMITSPTNELVLGEVFVSEF